MVVNQINYSARLTRVVPLALGLALATAGFAQQDTPSSISTLNLPQNPQVFGSPLPSVIKATAIVNGEVITQTDIDQRLALLAIANNAPIPADQVDRLRQQVLSNLIDETLQIQARQGRGDRNYATRMSTRPSSASLAMSSRRRTKWRNI